MEFKTDALMLKAVDYGENDKMVTLLTAARGKIGACMKGVKKANAKLKFAAQPFCFAEYVLAEKSGRHTVTSASLYDGFFSLREDVEKYYAAAVVCEACDKLLYEEMQGGELLVAAVSALTRMCEEDAAFPLIVFLLTALRLAGYPVRADLPALAVPERVSENPSVTFGDSSPARGAKTLAVPERESGVSASDLSFRVERSGIEKSQQYFNNKVEMSRQARHDNLENCGKTTSSPLAGERVLSSLFFDMEGGAFSLGKGTPASVVTYETVREALGYEAPPRTRDGEKRALRLLYSYFAYQTDSELTSLPEYVRML